MTGMNRGLRCLFGAMTAGLLLGGLAACGDYAGTAPPQETTAAEGTEAPAGQTGDAGSGQDAEEELEPVPASSDGPAQNWPEPDVPEEASEQTEEGVEAALHHWFEARQYARNTGDTGPLEDASTAECGFCSQQIEQVEETYENGWYNQELDQVGEIFIRLEEDNIATAIFLLDQGSFEAYWDDALVNEGEKREDTGWSVALVYEGRWIVADLVYVGPRDQVEDEIEAEQ